MEKNFTWKAPTKRSVTLVLSVFLFLGVFKEPFSLKLYIGSTKTWFLHVSMLRFHVCTQVCFHLISSVQIRTFENRIPNQTFEKWHNVIYRYVSYVKSETSWYLENRCKVFKTFWREGSGKSYLQPRKIEFYSKN